MKILQKAREFMLPHNRTARKLEALADKAAKDNFVVLPQSLREMAAELRAGA